MNFEPEREFIPLGSSTTFSCTVVGRAVWSIDPGADDEVTLNTAIAPQLSGNLTDVTGLVGISLSDYTNVDGYNVSVLFLSSSNVESRNGSVVTCGATTSITANPTDQEHHINVYGESELYFLTKLFIKKRQGCTQGCLIQVLPQIVLIIYRLLFYFLQQKVPHLLL